MDSLSLVLLGVIAFASLLQAISLVVVAREGLRVARRLDAFAERMGRDLRPALADLERASQNFADYQTKKADYVNGVFEHLNWAAISERLGKTPPGAGGRR